MWIFCNDAFLSIVDKAKTPGRLVVRARKKGDIERVFPGAKVSTTPDADYLYRAEIERGAVADAIAERVRGINYSNFKGSVPDRKRHDAYMGVWSVMNRYQQEK